MAVDPTTRAEAIESAAAAINSTTPTMVQAHAEASEAHIVEHGRYCPAPVACIGRPAVTIAVPVRVSSTGEPVGEVLAVYCPQCRSMAAEQARDAQ